MIKILPQNLINLANKFSKPLYLVGGAVRNYLIDNSLSKDLDICASIPMEQFVRAVEEIGLTINATYKRTGTVLFVDGKYHYEYTAFRRERYVGGAHTPEYTEFTENIYEDAIRRDFKCNAIYYDIKNQKIVDVLGGVNDVNNKVLDTVQEADKVFCSDGLRLMRLARFTGELNFKPTEKVLDSAKKYADNILDISPERILAELKMILSADCKYPFSSKSGHYDALKILDETRVLDRIIPELTAGRDMTQRADFHKYDVLEHSLRTVLYSKKVRLGALLHDVGKPFCFNKNGVYHNHAIYGEDIAEKVLKRLKADKETITLVKFLTREHMLDLDGCMRESKIRRFLATNHARIDELFDLKQADFMAGQDKDEVAPTIVKWQKILSEMKEDGTPFSKKDLNISASDLIAMGYENKEIGKELKNLFDYAVLNPKDNNREKLLILATKHRKT